MRSRRSSLAIVGLISLAGLTLILGLSSVALGYTTWRLGQIDRLEVAGSLTDAPSDPITARDVIASNGADGSAGGGAGSGSSGGANDDSLSGVAGGNAAGEASADSDAQRNRAASNNRNSNGIGKVTSRTVSPGENYLLVGTDSITGFDADDPVAHLRSANSHLADTIIVARLREDGTIALLSIPRDLLVNIAGTSRIEKINSAYNIDPTPHLRAARLIDTIENELGITLQHYAEIDLDGFRQLINGVNGVDVYFEKPLRDRSKGDYDNPAPDSSEFTIDAGWQLLDGDQALAYVRSRHLYEQNEDGSWQRKGVWNDLERNQRQREFLIDAIEQVANDFLSNPFDLRIGLTVAADALTTSDTLNVVTDGLRLVDQFRGIDFDTDVEEYELSVRDVVEPGRWSLALHNEAHNQKVLDVFRGIGVDDVVEQRVNVLVSGDNRWQITEELTTLGFQARVAGENPVPAASSATGTATGTAAQQTTLAYGSQGRFAAALLLSHLEEDVVLVGDPSLGENTIALHVSGEDAFPIISSDYRFVDLPPPLPASSQSDQSDEPTSQSDEPTS